MKELKSEVRDFMEQEIAELKYTPDYGVANLKKWDHIAVNRDKDGQYLVAGN